MTPGISAIASGWSAVTTRLRPMSTAASAAVGSLPLPQPHGERPGGGLRRARPRVVEREERGRAAKRGGDGVLEEAVRLRVGRDAGVGVDVDDAGQDQQPRRVDDLARRCRRTGQVRLDRADAAALDGDVGDPDPVAVTTVPPRTTRSATVSAPLISISWAPSQRQRRPTSRSRSSQPSSGMTVAKWFAASWPTLDEVAHEPYREEDLALADPPGRARGGPARVRRVVLPADVRPQVA